MTMMSSESIIDRRALLAGVAALPALGGALLPASAQAQVAAGGFSLKVVFGFARGSASARAFSLLEGGLARELGGPVEQIYMVGDQGRRAAATVAAAGPDEPVVLVITDFASVVIPIVYADVPERPDLRPIAKLSRGISLALVVPSNSEWRSWAALTSAKHQRSLRVATTGPRGPFGLFAAILAKLGGIPIEEVAVTSSLAVALEGVDQHVDAAVVTTFDIKPLNIMSNNSLVPIVTSGAARSPDFPDTPTIGEVTGDRRVDFTTSVSAFASSAMNDALAERLTRAFLAAGQAPEAVAAAARMNFPLRSTDPMWSRRPWRAIVASACGIGKSWDSPRPELKSRAASWDVLTESSDPHRIGNQQRGLILRPRQDGPLAWSWARWSLVPPAAKEVPAYPLNNARSDVKSGLMPLARPQAPAMFADRQVPASIAEVGFEALA